MAARISSHTTMLSPETILVLILGLDLARDHVSRIDVKPSHVYITDPVHRTDDDPCMYLVNRTYQSSRKREMY